MNFKIIIVNVFGQIAGNCLTHDKAWLHQLLLLEVQSISTKNTLVVKKGAAKN